MSILNNRYIKSTLIVGAVVALLLGIYAYAASTDINDGGAAGFGNEVIEGFTVSSHDFTLAANPVYIASWTFTLSTKATAAQSRLGDSGSADDWVVCTCALPAAGLVWVCTPTASTVLVADVDSFEVSAVNAEP